MALTLAPLLLDAGLDPSGVLAIRHAYVQEHKDTGVAGIHADSTYAEILQYTREQDANPRNFPVSPPRFWVVFIREGGDQARLWRRARKPGRIV